MRTVSSPSRLSRRQQQLIETVERLTRERGFPPTLREAAAAMGVCFSRVGQLARTAQAKGAMTREPGAARSWRVVKPAAPPKGPRRRQ